MEIVHLARRAPPAVGGVESYLRHVTQGLAERHRVRILAHRIDQGPYTRLTDSLRPPPTFTAFSDGAVAVEPLRFSRAARARMAPLVATVTPGLRRFAYGPMRVPLADAFARASAPELALRLDGADLLHVWGGDLFAELGVRAARLAGVPVVVTPFVHPGQWNDDPASARAYRRADLAIGLLEADCAVLRALGVPGARVVECGVCSPGVAVGGGAEIRRRHGIAGPIVLFLGVRRPYKGFDVLRDAVDALALEVPAVRVVFAGPGEPVDGHPAILDVGLVSDADRAAWLEAADVLSLPSEGEIYPVSILEAWSASTPVVTSDIPPLVELMERSGGGLAAPRAPAAHAAALAELLRGDARRQAAGRRGHDWWAQRGTPEAVTRRHEELYGRLVG
jgi:phosphatidylinositol alpha-1,6-mannosyltransferase